ncbi:cytosolic sulfotransferase 16-like [Salvia hispanica]|uniref:cytosolic sulfotransferase 16-like n=1 Tax=Salvia hispanica TaxID=49212 RepID=UPI00200938B1|nr:cytosolic sulfotransferase 16-like [Salvia hispanica]
MANSSSSPSRDLPKVNFWDVPDLLTQWEGFWLFSVLVEPAMTFRSNFHTRDNDVLLASFPKTGTTWLMALAHSILKKGESGDPLATANPHSLVPTVESEPLANYCNVDIYDASAPRLLHTHLPYSLLPDSVKNSACKIVYIARSPKDTLISTWHFYNLIFRRDKEPLPLDRAVDCFCSGVHPSGPFSDSVAEYWLESRRRPDKILFVKYEEIKSQPEREVSRIAEFLGRPLKEGEVEELLWRCSFERLKKLEVNTTAADARYFRKGEVGDWKNYLTSEMEDRIHQAVGLKLEALGLFF